MNIIDYLILENSQREHIDTLIMLFGPETIFQAIQIGLIKITDQVAYLIIH